LKFRCEQVYMNYIILATIFPESVTEFRTVQVLKAIERMSDGGLAGDRARWKRTCPTSLSGDFLLDVPDVNFIPRVAGRRHRDRAPAPGQTAASDPGLCSKW